LLNLKLLFFFKIRQKEGEVKEYLLRADYVSHDDLLLVDWLRNLGVGAIPQYGGRKITYLDFLESAWEIVQSLEHRVIIEDSAEAAYERIDKPE
jgi:hypothetical protein